MWKRLIWSVSGTDYYFGFVFSSSEVRRKEVEIIFIIIDQVQEWYVYGVLYCSFYKVSQSVSDFSQFIQSIQSHQRVQSNITSRPIRNHRFTSLYRQHLFYHNTKNGVFSPPNLNQTPYLYFILVFVLMERDATNAHINQ
jgi:hypothetical protein